MTDIHPDAEDRTYRAAVDWAVAQLLNTKAVAPDYLAPDGLEKIEDLDAGLQALMSDGPVLVDRARTDWRAYRALELGCARYLRNTCAIPDWAREWISDHLEGKLARPARPRGPSSKGGLHQLIGECIDALTAAGMIGIRNDATERRSACDVLAEALMRVGQQPSTFEGVKRVYLNWSRQQDQFEKVLAGRRRVTLS